VIGVEKGTTLSKPDDERDYEQTVTLVGGKDAPLGCVNHHPRWDMISDFSIVPEKPRLKKRESKSWRIIDPTRGVLVTSSQDGSVEPGWGEKLRTDSTGLWPL